MVVYPDIIEGSKLQIISQPGFRHSSECKPKCTVTQAVPFGQEIVATGKKHVQSYEDNDGDTVLEEFVEVEVVVDNKVHTGWVPHDLVSQERPTVELPDSDQSQGWFTTRSGFREKSKVQEFVDWCKGIANRLKGKPAFEPSESDIHSVARKIEEDAQREKLPLRQTTRIVEKLVGKCAIDNPKEFSASELKGPISYDTFVLPKLMNAPVTLTKKEKDETIAVTQTPLLHVGQLDIPGLNAQKLIEIDALSRTIFAEMANCIPIGQQYAMAVARVIKNREAAIEESLVRQAKAKKKQDKENPKKKTQDQEETPIKTREQNEFLWEKTAIHWPGKNISTKVASSPVQFSGWNNYVIDSKKLADDRKARAKKLIAGGMPAGKAHSQARKEIKEDPETLAYYKFNKSGMLHTLCPPSRADEDYYDGRKPYPELLAIWQNTVKIAVEAVLYPEEFAKKTDSLKDVLHYTSGRSSFYGFCPFRNAVVAGKKLDSHRCLNLWIDPERSPEYCAAAKKEVEPAKPAAKKTGDKKAGNTKSKAKRAPEKAERKKK